VLDEPISHLDTRQRSRMRAYLKRLHIELGHTMIYVTHDQEEAMAMADRITIMKDGKLLQTDTPETIYHHPVNIFVAGFMGEPAMNFLKCEYKRDNGRRYLQAVVSPDIKMSLPPQMDALAQADKLPAKVTIGIRPFYVGISLTETDTHTIPATVFVLEPLGDSTVVTVDVANTRMQVVADPDFRVDEQATVWLSFDPVRTRLFDTKTEDALLTTPNGN
jgi:multiple sugar transport system ATP-binding protein